MSRLYILIDSFKNIIVGTRALIILFVFMKNKPGEFIFEFININILMYIIKNFDMGIK